jgi:hypothetical protein
MGKSSDDQALIFFRASPALIRTFPYRGEILARSAKTASARGSLWTLEPVRPVKLISDSRVLLVHSVVGAINGLPFSPSATSLTRP